MANVTLYRCVRYHELPINPSTAHSAKQVVDYLDYLHSKTSQPNPHSETNLVMPVIIIIIIIIMSDDMWFIKVAIGELLNRLLVEDMPFWSEVYFELQ